LQQQISRMTPAASRRLRFACLLLVYLAFVALYVRHWITALPTSGTAPVPVQLLPFIGTLLGGTWAFYLIGHFLVGRIAGEYIFLLPLLTMIGSFLGTLVLLFFHLPLSGPGQETPLLYGSLYGLFNALASLRLFRRHLRQRTA
jgi:hypothetical protein